MGTWIETVCSNDLRSGDLLVVPLVGTWIETSDKNLGSANTQSFPLWERGLKRDLRKINFVYRCVVPLVGTWIETLSFEKEHLPAGVVPLVGTWIETWYPWQYKGSCFRRSPCGNVD